MPTTRWLAEIFTFPNPVNEKAARVVAGGVALLAVATLVTGSAWLYLLLVVGFAARTAAGPRFSLLGRVATQVVAQRLGAPRHVPGPPKRFAQAIGLVLTAAAALAGPLLGADLVARGLIGVLLVFATLESVLGFCAGCWLFARLMDWGLVPESTCEICRVPRVTMSRFTSPAISSEERS